MSSLGASAVRAPHLHSAAVLLFQLLQEVALQLQISALSHHVRLQGETSHDPLAVGVKQDTFNNKPMCGDPSARKNAGDVSAHVGGKEEIRLKALMQISPELCDVV